MNKTFLLTTLLLAAGLTATAQTGRTNTATTADANTTAAARQGNRSVQLASGTRLAAQLQQTLDVRKARVGDRVLLRTTQAIKQNGRTVVGKGARLVGHVTEVQQRAGGAAESRIGLVFDQLESGALTTPISATITSIAQASTHARAGAADDDFMTGADAAGSSRTRGSASAGGGGGLLGGVGSTVGGVANTAGGVLGSTTQAAGDVVGGTTGAVGGTVNGVGRTLGGVRVSQSGSASAEGGSTLSLTGGNLRLEKNTTFNLVLNESVEAGRDNQ